MLTARFIAARSRRAGRRAAVVLALAVTPLLAAQQVRDLVEAALDQKITDRIEIAEQPVRAALAELKTATGLRFVLDERAVEWMPYGEETRISIVMEDISVRRAVGRIFASLGLTLHVVDDKVVVVPAPVLERLRRRLSVDEVGLLRKLAERRWGALKPGEVAVDFRVPADEDPRVLLEQSLEAVGGRDALEQLEAATSRLGWLWTPEGSGIMIYSLSATIEERLDRPLDMYFRRMPLDRLLLELGRMIDITVHFEPGALQRVDARERQVDLVQRGMTTRQVLELIAGNTGLWYEVTEDGIVLGGPVGADGGGAAPRTPRVAAILRIPIGDDGTTIDFLIREDELPPEFIAFRDRKMPEIIEILRQRLTE